MPRKMRIINWPAWIEALDDGSCLQSNVKEALHAADHALGAGAPHDAGCARVFTRGIQTLRSIYDGRTKGADACKKATDAIRKFNSAAECAAPSASRAGRPPRKEVEIPAWMQIP